MAEATWITNRRNWAHDPRMQTLTHIYPAGAGAVKNLVADRSFSGVYSVRMDLPFGTLSDAYLHVTNGNAIYPTIPAGSVIDAVLYLSGPASNLESYIYVEYTDATFLQGASVTYNLASGLWFERVDVPPVTLNPAKFVSRIRVRTRNNNAPTQSIWFGGLDISMNQEVDSFVSGAGGVGRYYWEGAVDNSPSNRYAYWTTPMIGTGGQVSYGIRIEVVNRQNLPMRDITSHFIDGSINYDLDAENWKGSCTIVMDDPGLIVPLVDEYVRPTLIINKNGVTSESSLGMFNMDAPTERWSAGHDSWTYEGKDILSLLATWCLPPHRFATDAAGTVSATFQVNKDVAWGTAINTLLVTGAGLTQVQFNFPGLAGVSPSSLAWEAGDTILTMLTDLLLAAGWQKPWMTPNGIITSAPAGIDPRNVTPSLILATGENSQVRWPFEVDPETSRVGNRVVALSTKNVYEFLGTYTTPSAYQDGWTTNTEPPDNDAIKAWKKKGKHGPKPQGATTQVPNMVYPAPVPNFGNVPHHIESTATNEDPTHPLSHQRLGRWIDLPIITLPVVTDEAIVASHAKQALVDASNIPVRVRLTTEAMHRGLNEVYELNLSDAYGNPIRSGQGRYWCRGWTLQLGSPWEMTHNLTRVVGFDVASGL
jgi:hypothetical protein